MPIKFSNEFSDTVFRRLDVESLYSEAGVSSLQTRIPVRRHHNFWSDRLIWHQIFTGDFKHCFPWSRRGIATHWGRGLVALDQNTGSKAPWLLIRPFDRHQIFTGVSRRCFPWSRRGIATWWGGSRVALARISVRKSYNFWSNRLIAIKFSQEFPDTVFHGVDVESLLGEAEFSSLQSRVPVWKGHNFWSDHWISLKCLNEFRDAILLGVDVECLLGEKEVSSL